MDQHAAVDTAGKIMLDFAATTGLSSGRAPRRYLWTDAFAVCNFLELYRQTEESSWRELALQLVDQVHHVLGRHRPDSSRSGWISGLSEAEGELHPTRGGLRIGKRLDERHPGDPFDERLEWDRDGQYYHYLTKWMHALHRVSRVTKDDLFLRWALELSQATHAAFCFAGSTGGAKRLHWKMSIDLGRPQVASMGQHDPLDGLVTCRELQQAAEKFGLDLSLAAEMAELSAICRGKEWATDDALGIGGLLCDALRLAELSRGGRSSDRELLGEVVEAAQVGLEAFSTGNVLELPGRYRLAFRELGLAIGLQGLEGLPQLIEEPSLRPRLRSLTLYQPLAQKIERFWLDGVNQNSGSLQEHKEINMVMLATSLAPGQFLAAN